MRGKVFLCAARWRLYIVRILNHRLSDFLRTYYCDFLKMCIDGEASSAVMHSRQMLQTFHGLSPRLRTEASHAKYVKKGSRSRMCLLGVL